MLIKGIDYPERLLRAQRSKDLVIFAGAGVSRPPPSSLPLFPQLARRISANSGRAQEDNEPIDRYLGRLQNGGIRVHESAARILTAKDSHPHELHRLLLQAFGSPGDLRLVTTNFDPHFSTAARLLFDPSPDIFYGPALPLGGDFSGLIYLHGSAIKNPTQCVMTDEDFGRAYLTNGWATRFLAAMFERYDVLFVGYSHDDVVMNYLARGLPPNPHKMRFALTPKGTTSRWDFLGIRAIEYEKTTGENSHQVLTDSVREWVTESRRGLVDKVQRIQSLAEAKPPLEGEDNDYIKDVFSELDTTRLFLKHAKDPEWITWLEKQQLLQVVFANNGKASELEVELAVWMSENFVARHEQVLMGVIQRSKGIVGRILCRGIHRELRLRRQSIPSRLFSQWVALLLAQPIDALPFDDWALLLQSCCLPHDRAVAVQVFSLLTRPNITLKERWSVPNEDAERERVYFDLTLSELANHWLSSVWQTLFKPHLAEVYFSLEPVVSANLGGAQRLLEMGGYDPGHDPFRFHRQSIEPHDQNHYAEDLDLLINAARDILGYALQSLPDEGIQLIRRWFDSGVPILQRLATNGVANRTDIGPDEKLSWVIDHDLTFRFKTDVFRLIAFAYPSASKAARSLLLSSTLRGPNIGKDEYPNDIHDYEIFNLLFWIYRFAPECPLIAVALHRFQHLHPDFQSREFPDLDVWHSIGPSDEDLGLNPDIVASQSAGDFIQRILDVERSSPFDKGREDYCAAASLVVARNSAWGIEFLGELRRRRLRDDDLWSVIWRGWSNAKAGSSEWKNIFEAARVEDVPVSFLEGMAEVLERGSRREDRAIPDGLMSEAQEIAHKVWLYGLARSAAVATSAEGNWLTTAINRAGGKLAEFWLQRLSVARKLAGDSWTGIPTDITESIRVIIRGAGAESVYARIVFCSQLRYLFSLDPKFARNELITPFDWARDESRAMQCWQGFLVWGAWHPGFVDELLPHFNVLVERASELPEDLREALGNHIAHLAMFRLDDRSKDWIMSVVVPLDAADLKNVAASIDRLLADLETQVGERLWTDWLKAYWEARLFGSPEPLSAGEAGEMACWSLSVGRFATEAAELVSRMSDVLTFDQVAFPYRMDKKGLAKSDPDAAAKMLLVYLRSPKTFFYLEPDLISIWNDLVRSDVSRDTIKEIREALLHLGHDPDAVQQ